MDRQETTYAAALPAAFSYERRAFRRGWRTAVLVAVVALVAGAAGFAAAPTRVEAYTWSGWTTRYFTATTRECNASRELANRFIGPIQYYSSACTYRVRSRYAVIDTWAGWTDRLIEIENSAPYWNAWGMTLQVQMHFNGSAVRYSPESLICSKHAFLIKVAQTDCKVFGDGTTRATARMAYEASFSYLWASASVDRGAQQSIDKDGVKSVVTYWP